MNQRATMERDSSRACSWLQGWRFTYHALLFSQLFLYAFFMSNVLQDITALLPDTAVKGIERRRKQEHFHVRTADMRSCHFVSSYAAVTTFVEGWQEHVLLVPPVFWPFAFYCSFFTQGAREETKPRKEAGHPWFHVSHYSFTSVCPPIRRQEEERRAPVFMCRHVKTSEALTFLFLVGFLLKCSCSFIPRTGQS